MLKGLLNKKKELEQQIADVQATIEPQVALLRDQIADVNLQIGAATADKLKQLRDLSGKEFGVLHLTMGGVKVSQTVPKKVTWDQVKLSNLYDRIKEGGDDPKAYMKMELKVGEKEYEKFAPGIKDIFAEARTVTAGTPTVSFEEVADA